LKVDRKYLAQIFRKSISGQCHGIGKFIYLHFVIVIMRKSSTSNLANSVKKKFIEIGVDYFKERVESTKEDILKYVEKIIEKKIKRELQRLVYTVISAIIGILGCLFLVYGAIDLIIYLLEFPEVLTNLIFGVILLIVALIVYLQK